MNLKKLNLVATLVVILALTLPWTAFAYTWADPYDSPPGSVFAILGNNSNGAGYLPDETVHVDVVGPNGGYTLA